MNNPRLDQCSEYFYDDKGDKVESKCFLLFAGNNVQQGQGFSMELHLHSHDDPKAPKAAQVFIKIENLTVEQCSDVIVSLTHYVPDFKTVLRFDDLSNKPEKIDLEKVVKF